MLHTDNASGQERFDIHIRIARLGNGDGEFVVV